MQIYDAARAASVVLSIGIRRLKANAVLFANFTIRGMQQCGTQRSVTICFVETHERMKRHRKNIARCVK